MAIIEQVFEPQLSDIIYIIGAAVFTTLVSEAFSWLTMYRTSEYKDLVADIKGLQKKIDKLRELEFTPGGGASKGNKKKAHEDSLKELTQKMMSFKMKSTFLIAFFMIMFMRFMSNQFSGIVVAKLPFTPFGMIQGMTHRNLPGSDFTECAMIFIYVLSNVCIRPIIVKVLGFEPPRGMNKNSMFGPMAGQ